MMHKVICINDRKTRPGQIEVGETYYVDIGSVYMDEDGTAYGTVNQIIGKRLCEVGNLKLSHFKSAYIEETEGE